jgi:L-iditol 2-dehydrogenase
MPFVFPGIVKIPARNSFLEGAMLEPVNTVLKAIRRLNLLPQDQVLVVGQGPIGLMFTRLLALQKVKVIATDLIPERLELARKWGAVAAENPELGRKNVESVDAAIITAPSDAAAGEALDRVRGGGQVLTFAHTKRGAEVPIDLAKVCVDEKDLIGSYSSDVTLQKEVAGLVFSRRLDVRGLISHRFPLADTAAAIDLAAKPSPGALKIVVEAGS